MSAAIAWNIVCATFVRPSHKQGLLSFAVEILGLMSLDSLSLPAFLRSCSNESFFRQVSALLRTANLSALVLEKIATILAKLSKYHSNRRFFEAFAFPLLLSKLLSECGPQHAFLSLSLKTSLVNITGGSSSGYSSAGSVVGDGSESNFAIRNAKLTLSQASLHSNASSESRDAEKSSSTNDLNKQ